MSFFAWLAILSFLVLLYVYLGYPFLLIVFGSLLSFRKPEKTSVTPRVTLIISCYNEEAVIRSKLLNTLKLDYPKELLEVLVVSDASSDKTDEITLSFASKGIKLVRQEQRLGKTMGLNLAVPLAQGEIIVFSDANAMYHPDAVSRLVEYFANERIGYVVGEARYKDVSRSSASKSEGSYWSYEIFLKKIESRIHSVVGGDGAIYAIRKELYEPLEQTDINDFVNPLQIIAKGYRGVYAHEAVCEESPSGSFRKEFNRKVRIVNRSFNGLLRTKAVLNPFVSGLFCLEIISHKLLRWFSPFFIALFMVAIWGLAFQGGLVFHAISFLFLFFVILAYLGHVFADEHQSSLLSIPYYFLLINIASCLGIFQRLKGKVQATWDPPRIDSKDKKDQLFDNILLSILFVVFFMELTLIIDAVPWRAVSQYEVMLKSALLISFLLPVACKALCLSLHKKRDCKKAEGKSVLKELPAVSLVVCVHEGEAALLQDKLTDFAALDYPQEKMCIVVSVIGASGFLGDILIDCPLKVLTVESPDRGGIFAWNRAVLQCQTEIIIFSDIYCRLKKDTVKTIVDSFQDAAVGAVTCPPPLCGDEKMDCSRGGVPSSDFPHGCGGKEKCFTLREQVFSGLFAVRSIIARGGWNPAFSFEIYAAFRTMKRGFQVVEDSRLAVQCLLSQKYVGDPNSSVPEEMHTIFSLTNLHLLNPLKYGAVSFKLVSCKICNWCIPFFNMIIFFSCLALMKSASMYKLLLWSQVILFGVSLLALVFASRVGERKFQMNSVARFLVKNCVYLKGWYAFVVGKKLV